MVQQIESDRMGGNRQKYKDNGMWGVFCVRIKLAEEEYHMNREVEERKTKRSNRSIFGATRRKRGICGHERVGLKRTG